MALQKNVFALIILAMLSLAAGCDSDGSNDIIPAAGNNGGNGNPPPPPPPTGEDPFPVSDVFNMGSNNRILDPGLNADGTPSASSPDLQGATFAFQASSPDLQDAAFALPNLGANFTPVDYIGAFEQDTADVWAANWTVGINGNTTVWQPAAAGTLAGGTPAADGACPAGTTVDGSTSLPAAFSGTMDFCRLAPRYGTAGQTITLTNDNIYLLAAGFPGTYIGNGEAADGNAANDVDATLVIEPGTLVLGSVQEALVVTRGSQITAEGTEEDPIVMSSRDQFEDWVGGSDGESGRGEWAGLALMGYAASNECGSPCDVAAEGNIGAYGGTNDDDSSGSLRYVVVRHAGNDIDGNGNELNGITQFATGRNTSLSFLQVHKGLDDGIEWFGSTSFADHLVLTGNQDDSLDWGQGWIGGAQFVLIRHLADVAERGIEADNDSTNPDAAPISAPTLANLTILGEPGGDADGDGILLRVGTGALIYNTIVTGFADSCFDIDNASTLGRAGDPAVPDDGTLQVHNTILWCPGSEEIESGDFPAEDDVDPAVVATLFDASENNLVASPNLQAGGQPNPAAGGSTSLVSTDYIGAFPQDSAENWTLDWTISLNGNDTVWAPASGGTLGGNPPLADNVCPTGTTDIADQDLPADVGAGTMDLCQLAPRYGTDGETITLTNDNIYRLSSGFPGTYIGNGEAADGDSANDVAVTLVIEPGTLILGDVQEALIVTRGSRIEAAGTAADPIVMTSAMDFNDRVATGDGQSGRGEWAGLALMGYARSNECGDPCDVAAEGNVGAYGGADDADSSGELQYVVVRHAGNDIDGNGNELNGVTLFATGSGTVLSHIQVHNGLDDGMEFFGSTAFADHVLLTGNADDSLDWGQGWTGGAQFVVVKQAEDDGERGIEADNDGDNPDVVPISRPTLANLTLIGTPGTAEDDTTGILLRVGTGAAISNAIVTGFESCVDIDDAATFERFPDDLFIDNSVVSCTVNFTEE